MGDVSNFFQLPVTMDVTIDILQTSASLVIDNSNQEFEANAATAFQELFNNRHISMSVDTAMSELVVIDKGITIESTDNMALIIASIILSIGALVSLAAFLWDWSSKTPSDDSRFMAPLFVAIHLYDFVSDIILCYKISEAAHENGYDLYSSYLWLAVASAATIVVPLLLNTWYAVRIQQQKVIQGNQTASVWFAARFAIFVFLCLFTSGTYPVLTLVNSSIFGLQIFGAGLMSSELRELSKIKIRCTIFFENIPQIFIQIVFLYLEQIQIETILAMVSSLLSVAATLLIYFGEKDIEDEYQIAKYFLYLSTKNKVMSDEATHALDGNKKKKKGLRKKLAKIFGSTEKLIEVGSVTMKHDGIEVHIQHLVFKQQLDEHHISKEDFLKVQYRSNIENVLEAMWTHFGLNGIAAKKDDWNVQFKLDNDRHPRSGGSFAYSTSGCPSRTESPQIVSNNPEMARPRKESEVSAAGSTTGMLRQPGDVEDAENIEIVIREIVGRLNSVLERRSTYCPFGMPNSTLQLLPEEIHHSQSCIDF